MRLDVKRSGKTRSVSLVAARAPEDLGLEVLRFTNREVLSGLSLKIPRGKVVAIDLQAMDVHEMSFPDGSFDQVFTSCTFCSVRMLSICPTTPPMPITITSEAPRRCGMLRSIWATTG